MVKIKYFQSIKQYKAQILAALAANVASFAHGTILGWMSPALLVLLSPNSPLDSGQVTISEASWLGSIYHFGGVAGNFILGAISNSFGRRTALCFLAIPQLVFWLLIIFGYHVNYLFAARIISGIAGGGLFVALPLYISEISDKKIRGTLGSLLFLSVNMGVLFGFAIGANVSYDLFPLILISLPIAFFILMILFPETPHYFLANKQNDKVKKSLLFYKSLKLDSQDNQQLYDEYLQEVTESINKSTAKEKLSWADFAIPENRIALLRGIGLGSLYICSGAFAVVTYTSKIFEQTGVKFDANTSSIILAVLQFLGTYTSTIIIDRMPRRIILTLSTCGAGIGFILIGTFALFTQWYDLSQLSWIPVTSLSFAIYALSVGICPLTFVVLAELLPQRIRPIGSAISNCAANLLGFGVLKVFPPLMMDIGLHGVMYIFGGINFAGALYILICLPETKGKAI